MTLTTEPVTAEKPALCAFWSACACRARSRLESDRLLREFTSDCSFDTVRCCAATRALPDCTTSTKLRVSGRRSWPPEVAALTPKSTPARMAIAGTA